MSNTWLLQMTRSTIEKSKQGRAGGRGEVAILSRGSGEVTFEQRPKGGREGMEEEASPAEVTAGKKP